MLLCQCSVSVIVCLTCIKWQKNCSGIQGVILPSNTKQQKLQGHSMILGIAMASNVSQCNKWQKKQQRKYLYNAIHKYTENDLTKHAVNSEYSEYVTSAKIVIHVNCNISKLLILQDLKQYNTFYSYTPGVAEICGEPSNDHSFRLPQEQRQ